MIKIRNDDVKIKCHRCGNEYEMSMMRMDPSNKMNLACRSCIERKPVSSMGQKHSSMDAKPMQPKPTLAPSSQKEAQKQPSEMTEYFCSECKYNFKRASHLNVSRCPYCSSDGTVTEKGSTSRIISDASRMKE